MMVIGICLYEGFALIYIYRLWARRRRPGLVERCLLTLALLVPFGGWLIYAFLAPPPDEHPYRLPDHDYSSGGSHSSGDSHSPADSSGSH